MTRRIAALPLVLVLLLGCQSKLSTEHKLSLEPGESRSVVVDGPTFTQKVVVTLSSNQPVDVAVHLKKDVTDDKANNPLGSLKQSSAGTLNVQIPAKEAFVVLVTSGMKPSTVSLKIAGQ